MSSRPRVLIVDDDINILNGLRRLLRQASGQWEMVFTGGGQQALALMELSPFDVVVSDMRMPQIDGAQLLSEVQRRFPGTVRVILSGYADQDSVLRAIGTAHQYVAKPSDADTILDTIRRALELRRLVEQDGLRRLVGGLTNLPSPNDLYLRLMAELQSPRASVSSVADIIASDVAMSAELLRVTNSSFFALGGRNATALQAVRVLGFDTVRALVLRTTLFRQFSGSAATAMINRINAHSMVVGGLARAIAKAESLAPLAVEHAFTAGMLSHIGSLVLLDADPRGYARAMSRVGPDRAMAAAETEMFGASHAELGAYLLGLWGFPDPVIEAVAYCGRPGACVFRRPTALMALHVAKALGSPYPLAEDSTGLPLDEAYVRGLGLCDRIPLWQELVQTQLDGART